MGRISYRVKIWLPRLGFLLLLLAIGFLAENIYYRARSWQREATKVGAQKIVVIGGSVSHGLDFHHLENALKEASPHSPFTIEFLSYPQFSVRNLNSAFEFASTLEPNYILLQIGCDDRDVAASELKKELPAWLFLRSHLKKPLPPDLEGFNEDLASIFKTYAAENDDQALWQLQAFLKKYVKHRVPVTSLKQLEHAVLAEAYKMRGQGAFQNGTLLQIGRLLRGQPDPEEYASDPMKFSREKIAWLKESWQQIESFGCAAYTNKDSPDVYDRIAVCMAKENTPAETLSATLENNPWLTAYLFRGFSSEKIERTEPLSRLIAGILERIPKPRPSEDSQEIDPVAMKLLEMKITAVARKAHSRRQQLLLLHYPDTNYPFVDHLAQIAGIHAIKADKLFPEKVRLSNRRAYFLDDLSCGNGHLTELGARFWANRVARELLKVSRPN